MNDQNVEEIVGGLERLLEEKDLPGLLFDDLRPDSKQQVIKVDEENARDPKEDDIWFFGDIHGDLLGMKAAIKYAQKVSEQDRKKPFFVFLGDLTDRGPLDYLVLLEFYSMILDEEQRGRMCVIAGNHDECLKYSEEREEFYATVKPAEFSDWLNEHPDEVWQRLGKVTVEFFSRVPRAIFMPDGLFCAHAGVPHVDLHDGINSLEKLNGEKCLEDFVWTRADERAPKKRPNRNTRGCQFGRKDFEAFCEVASKVLGQPVDRMLRGHDHYLEGHRHYERYEDKNMLTLNTRCWQPDTNGGPGAPYLCLARWVKGCMPEVHRIKAPKDLMEKVARNYGKDWADEPTSEAALARAKEALEAAAVAARNSMEALQVWLSY